MSPARASLLTLLLAPVTALGSELDFSTDFLEAQYSRIDPDSADAITGTSSRLSLTVSPGSWLILEREMLSRDNQDLPGRVAVEYNALLVGAGGMITDRGMWYLEGGPVTARVSLQDTRRSVSMAAGIRTRISPRFELGGGPRVGGVSRLDPASGEALMRVHGVFELSDQVAISGSYDYHGDDRQWRLGARLNW
ncbi:hypothetical protein [Natronospira sp.]|uniref:hypothetical protein n=1 Tax=Natronospira sp. TaxID=2024970 RepID=UPI003872B0F0